MIDRISLQGYVTTTYDRLVREFGLPVPGDGSKVPFEWHVQNVDHLVKVYPWKRTSDYDSRLPASSELKTGDRCWNIGGVSIRDAEFIRELVI